MSPVIGEGPKKVLRERGPLSDLGKVLLSDEEEIFRLGHRAR
jgi:hypothetical protein